MANMVYDQRTADISPKGSFRSWKLGAGRYVGPLHSSFEIQLEVFILPNVRPYLWDKVRPIKVEKWQTVDDTEKRKEEHSGILSSC